MQQGHFLLFAERHSTVTYVYHAADNEKQS